MDFKKIKEQLFSNTKDKSKKCINDEKEDNNKTKEKSNSRIYNLSVLLIIGIMLLIIGSFFSKNTKQASIPNDLNDSKNINNVMVTDKNNNEKAINSSVKENLSYKEKIQGELIEILQKIDGVGKVEAMIYFESGEEQIPAFNVNDSKSNTEEKDTTGGQRNITQENGGSTVVMESDGSKTSPLIVKTYNPKITGVCIVAQGASNQITELRVRQAVTNLFGLNESEVQVYPMKD